MEADIENARGAWSWAVAQAELGYVEQALDGICLFYDWRGRCQQGEELCREAVEQLRPRVAGAQCSLLARLLAWHGWFSQVLDHLDVATARLHESLALLDDPALAAQDGGNTRALALYALGHATYGTNRAEARRRWEESLAAYRALADQWGVAQVLNSLGLLALDMSDYPIARQLLEESLAISQTLGDRKSMAHALCHIGNVHANQGDLTAAEEVVGRSIAMSHALGDRLGAADSMGCMAGALAYGGHFVESAALFGQAAAIYAELGAGHAYAFGIHMLAWINVNLGNYELARQQYQSAQSIWAERNHRHGLALSSLGLGEMALVFEDFEQARLLLTDGIARFDAVRQQDEQAITLASLARAYCGLGRRTEARHCVQQALQIAQSIGAFAPALFALEAYALILADEGEAARTLEIYTLIGQHPYLKCSRWRQDSYDRYVSPRVAALSPGEKEAAITRGRQGDVQATVATILAELSSAAA